MGKKTKKKRSKKKVVRKRKARKKSVKGTRAQVFRGTREKGKTTGQTKKDLMKNSRGKIVSKVANAAGRKQYKKNGLDKWTKAFVEARKNLGLTGFVPIKKGSDFYKETMRIYKN